MGAVKVSTEGPLEEEINEASENHGSFLLQKTWVGTLNFVGAGADKGPQTSFALRGI